MPEKNRTPVLDAIALLLFLASMGMLLAFVVLPAVAVNMRLPLDLRKIAPPCTTIQALRGLWTHRAATDAASLIKSRSSLLKTDYAGYHQWTTPQGSYWIPAMTDESLWILLGQEQKDIYDEGEAVVKPGDVVLDCGAHVGVFTRVALRRGAELVVAIEPAPENLECLRRNFAAEIRQGRVLVYPKGVWNKVDVLPMHMNRNSAGDSFVLDLDPGQGVRDLPLTTIDKIVSELRLSRVDFIKMDIKGAEVRALQGAARTLADYQPRMSIAAEHLEDDPEMIPKTVMSANARYRTVCGSCFLEKGAARPEVLHFY